MLCSRAPVVAAWLLLLGCEKAIVLGDRESPLPAASAGASTGGAASPPSGGAAGSISAAAGALSGGSGGQAATDAPVPGRLVWSTDHESGDIADWEDGGTYYGGEYEWGEFAFDVSEGAGRYGSLGISITIDTGFRDEPSQGVRVYRRIEDAPAFYTAWFRLEEAHTVEDWWSISLFHARDDTLSLDNDVSLWDVRVVDTPSGEMALQFFDLDQMTGITADTRGYVAPGEWFELAFYLDYRPPDATRVVVLRDGALLFDVKNLHSTLETNVFWAIGNGAGLLEPRESTLQIDDASIRLAAGTQ
jgi:hypothetical protein